jgi:hypothetical protein
MNKSEIPTTELETPKEENNNIRFIKNEEGKRIWQKLKDSEVELMKRNKELGVVIT